MERQAPFLLKKIGEVMLRRIRIGIITSAHGIRGEAKVYPTTDDKGRFRQVKACVLVSEDEKKEKETFLEGVRENKNMLLCKFKGIDSPEELRQYRNYGIYVDRDSLPRLAENEHYIGDLIGLKVLTDTGEDLGLVKNVFETGANHVMEVELHNGKILLFPYIKDCILAVSLEKQEILVHVMDGLLDL